MFLINGIPVETSSIRLYLPSCIVTCLSCSQTHNFVILLTSQTQAQEQPGKLHQWSTKGLAASEVWIIQYSRTKPVSSLISAIKSCNILHPELMVAYDSPHFLQLAANTVDAVMFTFSRAERYCSATEIILIDETIPSFS